MQTRQFRNIREYMDEFQRMHRVHAAMHCGVPLMVRPRANELSPREVMLLR